MRRFVAVVVFLLAPDTISLAGAQKMSNSLRHHRAADKDKRAVTGSVTGRKVEELDEDDRKYWEILSRQQFSLSSPVAPSPRPPPATVSPSPQPVFNPTSRPSLLPTRAPTIVAPTAPVLQPSPGIPTVAPTNAPFMIPTLAPIPSPTPLPTSTPSSHPTFVPTNDPTESPTPLPTSTPSTQPTFVPTTDPTESPSEPPSRMGQCSLAATADCVTLPERESCSTLQQVPNDELTCSAPPTELGWIYSGDNCGSDDSLRVGFTCEDSNGGPTSSVVSYMVVRGANTGVEYFSGLLFRMTGGIPVSSMFVMSSGDPDIVLDSSVDVIITRSNMQGEILQSMTIPTSCDPSADALTLGKKFGSTNFDSYTTDESGLVKGSRQVQWEYVVTNDGNVDAQVTSIMTNTTGDVVDLMPTDDVILEVGGDFRVPVTKTISLLESGIYTGAVDFAAVSTEGECSARALSSFAIT